jgi:hypothetical protein
MLARMKLDIHSVDAAPEGLVGTDFSLVVILA